MNPATTYLTADGRKELEKELEYLLKVRMPEIALRIKEAKELGDLSENAEYAAAREEQGFVAGRILEIQAILSVAQTVHGAKRDDTVHVGSIIVVKRGDLEALQTYTIVGSAEADPSLGKISNESPLGRAFIGRKRGDEVVVSIPTGKVTFTILEIK